jgi:hypothetical protein
MALTSFAIYTVRPTEGNTCHAPCFASCTFCWFALLQVVLPVVSTTLRILRVNCRAGSHVLVCVLPDQGEGRV